MTELHRLANFIRKSSPTIFKVRTRSFSIKKYRQGDCAKNNDETFRITIEKTLDILLQQGVLLHEWAHTISWGLDGEDEHGEFFKAAINRAMDLWMDWLEHNSVE
jgi:hypothetical protein